MTLSSVIPALRRYLYAPMHNTNTKGYAAITAVIFMLLISLTIISAFTFFTLQEVKTNHAYVKSIDSHYISESGIEDAAYRIIAQKLIGASQMLGVGSGTTTVTVTTSGNTRVVESSGLRDNFQRNLQTTVETTPVGVGFYYGVQVGDGGLTMGNNAQVNGNIYSNGSIVGSNGATITGDAIVAGGIDSNPEVQWTAHTIDQHFASTNASRDIAQSFTMTADGVIPQLSVLIGKVGNPSGDITVHITIDNGGKPNTSDIANATIKNGVVGSTPSWITVAFAAPPTVTNGTTYWIVLDYGSDSLTNHWIWRKDASNAYPNNVGKYANNWTSGGTTWVDTNGDLAFQVWIGGTITKIEGVTIGNAMSGTGRANLFVNDTIHGSACPNAYCIVENPARENLPISDGIIQDWKNAASCLTCAIINGDYILTNSATASLGPAKITGKLIVDNGAVLTVTGTIWVVGDIVASNNNTIIKLGPGYGATSGVILTDNKIAVSNNVVFQGSGQAGSYVMLLSAKDSTAEEIILVDNNSIGVIYYAGKGRIKFSNNGAAKEAVAYGITLDNNATITYESGLANAQFSSGPSGGFIIKKWQEVP